MATTSSQVLILGAGAAGLAAAGQLARAGTRSIILEARDRTGGRVHTIRDPRFSLPIDTGAEFIHGKPKETREILSAAHMVAYDVDDEHWDSAKGKPTKFKDFWGLIDSMMEKIDKHKGRDQTFAEFVAKHPRLPKRVVRHSIAYIEGFDAADAKVAGVEWIKQSNRAEEKLGDALLRPVGGYDGIIRWMHDQLGDMGEVHLNSIVARVNWKRSSVQVQTADGQTHHASALIITLPLGVLQAPPRAPGSVQFAPELSDKQEALNKLHMGGVVKFVLQFREPFWEKAIDEELAFLHCVDELVPVWWTMRPLRAPVLTGWAGGPAAIRLSNKPPERLLDIALDALSRATGVSRTKIASLLNAWLVTDWLSDPFTRGAYSFGGVGGAKMARQLAKPIEQTLFFAGEATHDGMAGTVSGAIASGYRAAEEVLRGS